MQPLKTLEHVILRLAILFLFVLFFADATNFLMQFTERGFAVIMKLSPAFKDTSKGRH